MKVSVAAILTALLLLTGCAKTPAPAPLATVPDVDLERYRGTWIEIARYENRFEKGCFGASATYVPHGDHILVTNRCFDRTGIQSGEANGRAYAVEGSHNTKLRVSFFRPFYGDYWVLMVGKNYQYSVVGEPTRRYLWILSRTHTLSDADKKTILDTLPSLGYDASKLYWTSSPSN